MCDPPKEEIPKGIEAIKQLKAWARKEKKRLETLSPPAAKRKKEKYDKELPF